MGGKGRRRREKNYREAHGGGAVGSTLPPPPKAADVDAVPSKLRQIMQFRRPNLSPPLQDASKKRGKSDKGSLEADKHDNHPKRKKELHNVLLKGKQDDDAVLDGSDNEADKKRKRKRKRVTMDDLQIQKLNMAVGGTKRREKRKKFFEERKKRMKKTKTEEVIDFPGREQIKFGDVVEAPPKLTFPKASKAHHDAFHERLRLEAVEAYRKKKGWTSRPGIRVPPALTALPSE